MNNNRLRKILAISACIALSGNIANFAYADSVIIQSTYTATANGTSGKIYLRPAFQNYDWVEGDSAELYGGALTVYNYSSTNRNGTLIADTGSLNVTSGTLTIGSESSIQEAVLTEMATGTNLIISGGYARFDASDTLGGNISLSSGTLYINDTIKQGIYTQTNGSATITGTQFKLNNDQDVVSGGTFNIGRGTSEANVEISSGVIDAGATVNIANNGTLSITGGEVTLSNADTYNGNVTMSEGSLALVGISKRQSGTFTQSGGTTTITGSNFDLSNVSDSITGGTLNIGDSSTAGSITVSQGTITNNAAVNITSNGSMNINGGTVTLDNTDSWSGKVGISSGALNLNSVTKSSDAVFTQTGGTTTITGNSFELNNSQDSIDGGTLNVGKGITSGTLTLSKGSVSESTVVNISEAGNVNVKNGSMVVDSGDTWGGIIDVSGGSLNVKNTSKEGILTQSDGTVTITGTKFDLNNESDLLDGGLLKVGDGRTASKLTVSKGTITSYSTVNIDSKSTLDITGGSVELDSGDSWNGTVNNSGGSLALVGISKSGIYTQTSGTTDITGRSFSLDNENDVISGGTVNIGGTSASNLTVSKGSISEDATLNIASNSKLSVNGGDVDIGSNSNWSGTIDVSDGNLNLNNAVKQSTGKFTQSGGTTTIVGTGMELNNAQDKITGGTVNIGNGSTASDLTVSQNTIGVSPTINIKKQGTLNIKGGQVSLENSDSWVGNVNITDGKLNINSLSKNSEGTFIQNGGTTTVTGTGFSMNNDSDSVASGTFNIGDGTSVTEMTLSNGSISSTAVTNINSNATLNLKGGSLSLENGDTYNGKINVSGGSLALVGITKNSSGILTQTSGSTTVSGTTFALNNTQDAITGGSLTVGTEADSSTLTVSAGKIAKDVTTTIANGSTLNIAGGTVDLDSTDNINGNIGISSGNLSIDGLTKASTSTFVQSGGKTLLTSSEFDLNNSSDVISGGTLEIGNKTDSAILKVSQGSIESGSEIKINHNATLAVTGGDVNLDSGDTWNGGLTISSGTLNINGMNNTTSGTFSQTGGTTNIKGTSNFNLNSSGSNITGGEINIGDGTSASTLTLSQGNLTQEAIVSLNKNSKLNVAGAEATLDSTDTWSGNVTVSSGSLTLNGVQKDTTATLTQTGGTTTITGTGTDLNNAQDTITGGTLNIGDGTTTSDLTVSRNTISKDPTINIRKSGTLKVNGGEVNLDKTDSWTGNVSLTQGNLNIDSLAKDSSGQFIQSGGTTTVTGTDFDLNNSSDTISGGTINIGNGSTVTEMSVSNGSIHSDTTTNINSNATLNIKGGTVSLENSDKYDGNINVSGGSLALVGITKNSQGVLKQTSGTTTISGTSFALNNSKDSITGGTLNVGSDTSETTLTVENGTIGADTATNISSGSTVNVTGGNVTLNSNDTVKGNLNVTNGSLTLDGITKPTDGTFTQSGGVATTTGDVEILNSNNDKISSGTLNIGSSTGSSKFKIAGGLLEKAAKIRLAQGSSMEVSDGSVTIDGTTDTTEGSITVSGGELNLTDGVDKTTTTTETFNQTSGTVNIQDSKLVLNTTDSQISGGTVNLSNSELDINNSSSNKAEINSAKSILSIRKGSKLTVNGGTIDKDSQVTVEKRATLTSANDNNDITIDGSNDKLEGNLQISKGNVTLSDGLTKATSSTGTYNQTGGEVTLENSTLSLTESKSKISGGKINLKDSSTLTVPKGSGAEITGGTIVIDDTSVLNYLASKGLIQVTEGNNINIDTSGLINMVNSVRTNSVINTLTINNSEGNNGSANFAIDMYARSNDKASADTITANAIKASTSGTKATINISDYNLIGDVMGKDAPIDAHIDLGKIFKADELDKEIVFAANDKEIFTPIGYYKLNPSAENDGSYSFDLERYNPQVHRGQVATVASYMNQLVVNDTLFNRAQIRRYGAGYDEMFKNRTAILDGHTKFQRTIRESQVWTEAFGNFETLKMTRGNDLVRNNSWGFIVGGDFGLKDLKDGWSLMPTAYIAYNGGHQTFSGVGVYENGAQIGFMGSFMKKDFMETAIINAGLYGTSMDFSDNTDNTFNYFFGLASRTSYDWKLGSHFKIQPNVQVSYNMFGGASWDTNYGSMGMKNNFLNGFNIGPGVNFILEQETWNMYATIAYSWNLFGGVGGKAGNVDLPSIRMAHGYLQYGLGFTKTFSDRFNMYAQATVRNVGRTGIICSGGLNWKF